MPNYGNDWVPPPSDFYYQGWNMVYASHAANLALHNFQYDPSPIDSYNNEHLINDLSSFQVPGNDTVYTSYGVDTPVSAHNDVMWYSGTGIIVGAYSNYSLLAWGCDSHRLPYYVNYASETALTKTPAGIDIMSTRDNGMDRETFAEVVKRLTYLGDETISQMAAALNRTVQDGGRHGMPRITTCDDECKSNKGLQTIVGAKGYLASVGI
jgi:hypothetical protein